MAPLCDYPVFSKMPVYMVALGVGRESKRRTCMLIGTDTREELKKWLQNME